MAKSTRSASDDASALGRSSAPCGRSNDVTFDGDANGERVDIGVEATGPDFGIQLTRSVEVTCERVVVTETTETDVVATETGSETASG